MNKALLDTDTLSELIKGINRTVARNATAYRLVFGRYTISSITVMELVRGFQKNQNPRRLQAFLTAIASEEVIPFGKAEGERSGRIAGDLERVGRPIGMADPMIAAIALEHGLELITGNTAHFERIRQAGYPLVLGNWRL